MRILRLAFITPLLFFLLVQISAWFKLHIRLVLAVSFGTVGLIDEYVMRLLPAEIEPRAAGGLGVS